MSATQHRAKRRRQSAANLNLSSSSDAHLLTRLHPVRSCFQSFLTDKDAARAMQASRSVTVSLLVDYGFVDHVFLFSTLAEHNRGLALYGRYHMRILRLSLSDKWTRNTKRLQLPPSLLALSTGPPYPDWDALLSLSAATKPAFDDWSKQQLFEERMSDQVEGPGGEAEFRQLIRPLCQDGTAAWDKRLHSSCDGAFNMPLPPGTLPPGLRSLQLNHEFNQPLQPGSIPDSVETLLFGIGFNQPLEVGHLPASLTHLVFGCLYYQPLLPGVLPAGLLRLRLGSSLWLPGLLPGQLQHLTLGDRFDASLSPGHIPPSVTHLRLGERFNTPLQPGSIPRRVINLSLGTEDFDQTLLPGVLPTSLRALAISRRFRHALQPGSLPDGLEVLAFHQWSIFNQVLRPGVIPSSVVLVSMGRQYGQELVAGGIPATVRWLRLPHSYASKDLSGVLSPSTRLIYH